jgi:hypothetical protein
MRSGILWRKFRVGCRLYVTFEHFVVEVVITGITWAKVSCITLNTDRCIASRIALGVRTCILELR